MVVDFFFGGHSFKISDSFFVGYLRSMQKSWLNHLILEEIETALRLMEQQQPSPPPSVEDDTSSSPADVGMDPTADASAGDLTGGDVSGGDTTSPPEAGGTDGGSGGGGLEGDALGDDTDAGMGGDTGGGGGMFGLGGGGGGGGGGGFDDAGGEGDGIAPEDMPGAEVAPGPEKRPDDPIGAAMDEIEKISGETNDPQQILNAVKSSIQANFGDYKDAWPIVQQLKDTGNRTLAAVADRLSLFITGVLEEKLLRTKSKTKVLRQKDYGDFSIRKVVRRKHGFNVPQVQFDVSKSPTRKSWYIGFNTLEQARKFASRKHPVPPKPQDAVFKEVVQGLVQEEMAKTFLQSPEGRMRMLQTWIREINDVINEMEIVEENSEPIYYLGDVRENLETVRDKLRGELERVESSLQKQRARGRLNK